MSFHSPVSSCVISSATSQSMLQYPFRTVLRAQLRLHAEVLHGGVGFGDDLDLVPFFPEGGHDLARQVGFPGARVARQQQASAFEAVEHGVFRDLPVHRAATRTLGLDSGDPVLALEALDLLAPIHGRAVGMPFADTRPSTRPWNFLGRSWKTTQSVLTAFRYLGGTAASASRMRETATYSEAITKSCTGRQLPDSLNNVGRKDSSLCLHEEQHALVRTQH